MPRDETIRDLVRDLDEMVECQEASGELTVEELVDYKRSVGKVRASLSKLLDHPQAVGIAFDGQAFSGEDLRVRIEAAAPDPL
jgi:hypothetical protein